MIVKGDGDDGTPDMGLRVQLKPRSQGFDTVPILSFLGIVLLTINQGFRSYDSFVWWTKVLVGAVFIGFANITAYDSGISHSKSSVAETLLTFVGLLLLGLGWRVPQRRFKFWVGIMLPGGLVVMSGNILAHKAGGSFSRHAHITQL